MILEAKTEELRGGVQSISNKAKSLSLEVEELKEIRKSLKTDLEQALQKTTTALAPNLGETLARNFNHKTKNFIDNHLDTLKQIQYQTDRTTTAIQLIVRKSKKRLILTGVFLVLAVCFACFTMAAGLFYFYPQHHYIKYENGLEQNKQMIYGKILMDNFKKLTPEDQHLLFSYIEKFVKKPTF